MSRHRTSIAKLPDYCMRDSCAAITIAGTRPKTAKTVRNITEKVCPGCAFNALNKHDGRTVAQCAIVTDHTESIS